MTYTLSQTTAVIHLVYQDYDPLCPEGVENIFSIPARILAFNGSKLTLEELGENPKTYNFYLTQAPNGSKHWDVHPDDLNGADDVRLSLVLDNSLS